MAKLVQAIEQIMAEHGAATARVATARAATARVATARAATARAATARVATALNNPLQCAGTKKKRNVGMEDEIAAKQHIWRLDQAEDYAALVEMLGPDAADGVSIHDPETDRVIEGESMIIAAASTCKADCILRMRKTGKTWSPSIKSRNGGNSSVLNHTRRSAVVFRKGGDLHHLLPNMDSIIQIYNEKRAAGVHQEMPLSELGSLSNADREALIEVIAYFMFSGTGSFGRSRAPADSVMIVSGAAIEFHGMRTKEERLRYVESHYDSFILAVRSSKGMKVFRWKDDAQRACARKRSLYDELEECQPWIHETTDEKDGIPAHNNPDNRVKLNGALHIRWAKQADRKPNS